MHLMAQIVLWTLAVSAVLNIALFGWISYRRGQLGNPVLWLLGAGLATMSASCIMTALDAWTSTSAWFVVGSSLAAAAILFATGRVQSYDAHEKVQDEATTIAAE